MHSHHHKAESTISDKSDLLTALDDMKRAIDAHHMKTEPFVYSTKHGEPPTDCDSLSDSME